MENIRQAVERARGRNSEGEDQRAPGLAHSLNKSGSHESPIEEMELDREHLESRRIVGHDSEDSRSRSFDMLRTQVLQSMDLKDWKTLAVTSPTPGCGKTVTAINLALSIARQPERSVLLVDLDLRKAEIANCLGITFKDGVTDVLDGRVTLANALVPIRVGEQRATVLPTKSIKSGSAERMASQALGAMLQDIRRDYPAQIVILDMPPVLTGDDVLTVLPKLDCVLLVAAVGVSSLSQISECNKHLQSADVVRFVLNKTPGSIPVHNYKYAS